MNKRGIKEAIVRGAAIGTTLVGLNLIANDVSASGPDACYRLTLPGESLSIISHKIRVPLTTLLALNPLPNPDLIYPDQLIRTPCLQPTAETAAAIPVDIMAGRTIDRAIPLNLGTSYWTLKNSYHESNQLFLQLIDMNPPDKFNRYDIKISIPRAGNAFWQDRLWNSHLPSIDHITADFFAPEQLNELRAWEQTKGSYPKPKAEASMQRPIDPNYNGGDMILHVEGLRPVYNDKGKLMPWIGVLSYTANDNETILKNIQKTEWWWWGGGQPDIPLPDQVPIAIDASVYFAEPGH